MADTGERSSTLLEEFQATRKALDRLREAVDVLAERDKRRRRHAWILTGLMIGQLVVIALMITGAVVFVMDDHNDDQRFAQANRNAFLISCEAQNDQRGVMRADNVQDAELLISLTNAEVTRPELATAYR